MESLPRVQLDVLRTLRDGGRMHVYELKRRVGSRSVYAAVSALQLKDLVDAEWEPGEDGKPPRKMVELNAVGERVLANADRATTHLAQLAPRMT